MGFLGTIGIGFEADTSKLQSGLSSASGLITSFGGIATGGAAIAAGAILGIGAAAVSFGIDSMKSAGDFQQSMLKVQAYAGLTKKQSDDMSNSILDMASKVGQSPKALADAIYPIVSSGYAASDALRILDLSAKTASASGADTSQVATALTQALTNFKAPAKDAGMYMDIINKTTSEGTMQMPGYAAIIGTLSNKASNANVSFIDMNAALATLTTTGFPSVAKANTALSNLFTQIGPKIDTLAGKAKAMGLDFNESSFKTMSLSEKVAELNKITGGDQGKLLTLLGGNSVALAAFNSLITGTDKFKKNLEGLKDSGGQTDKAFETASSGMNASLGRLTAGFDVLKVKVGTQLLPLITPLINWIAQGVTKFTDWLGSGNRLSNGFQTLEQKMKPVTDALIKNLLPAIQNLAKNLEPFVKQAIDWAVKNDVLGKTMKVVADVIKLIADGINIATPYVVQIAKALGDFANDISTRLGPALDNLKILWDGLWPYLSVILDGAFKIIKAIISQAWNWISTIFKVTLDILGGNWGQAWDDIKDYLKNTFENLKTIIKGALEVFMGIFGQKKEDIRQKIVAPFEAAKDGINSFFNWANNAIGGFGQNFMTQMHNMHIPGYAEGVMNFQAGGGSAGGFAIVGEKGPELVWLPNGSNVYPNGTTPSSIGATGAASRSQSANAAGGGDTHVHVHLDSTEIMHVIANKQARYTRLKTGKKAL